MPACPGEYASKFAAEYEGTGTIEPSCLSTVPRTTGRITVDSGPVPRVAAPPSPPMPTSGRSPHRPLPLFNAPIPLPKILMRCNEKARAALMCSEAIRAGIPITCSTNFKVAAAGTRPALSFRSAVSRFQAKISARSARRAITCQRAWPHSETRRERRRHIMERSAAIAADFLWRAQHAQPVAARGTFRGQTLHRPAGQILHPFASQSDGPAEIGRRTPASM